MQGSGGLPTKYSFGVCRGQAGYQLDIHHWVRWIGIEYSMIRMIGLGGLELKIPYSE